VTSLASSRRPNTGYREPPRSPAARPTSRP
jgi:hypothetical protein